MIDASLDDAGLILALQKGIHLEAEPFGAQPETLFKRIQEFRENGLIRRIGSVFNVSQLGYKSALCGITVPENALDSIASILSLYSGITHCYLRDPGPSASALPNLWFTLSTPGGVFDATLQRIQQECKLPIRVAPAIQKFKVQVVLDPNQIHGQKRARQDEESEIPFVGTQVITPTPKEQALIVKLHEEFPLCRRPFAQIAESCGYTEDSLLALLKFWKEIGVLRRIAVLARHQKLGFKANGMCTWQIPPERIQQAGMTLAARKEVTHCYERVSFLDFPYNLYAMIHSDTEEHLRNLAADLSQELGFTLGKLFLSVKEYKKTSLVPFA